VHHRPPLPTNHRQSRPRPRRRRRVRRWRGPGTALASADLGTGSHNYLDGVTRLDFPFLNAIKDITAPYEVGVRTAADWEQAILSGFAAVRSLRDNNGGTVILDATSRSLAFQDAETAQSPA